MATGPLFPKLPEDLASLSDAEVTKLREEHETAKQLIADDDAEFLGELSADEIIAQLKTGVQQIQALDADLAQRQTAFENFQNAKAEALAELEPKAEEAEETTEETLEVVAEEGGDEGDGDDSEGGDAEEVEEKVEERELVLAAAETPAPRYSRTPPAPAAERIAEPTVVAQAGTALVASGGFKVDFPGPLDPVGLMHVQKAAIDEYGPAQKVDERGKYRTEGPHGAVIWDGPRVKTAKAEFEFPTERTLTGAEDDVEKIRAALPEYVSFFGQSGGHGGEALTASGGLCAPLTPIYTMPNFGTEAEPVWDALPVFRAARGGVNVPAATYIADITSAISSISEANDALGGTFATKSCQDLTCPDYTETAVQILAHCREYGNLNARAWPEKIAHENALTMQALSRTSEGFMLDRIKALSINVTQAQALGSLIDLVYAITKSVSSMRYLLRMPANSRFRALMPRWVLDLLVMDTVSTQFDRFRNQESLTAYLRSIGIDPVFYLDTPSTGTSQGFSAETASAIDDFPDVVQWAIYPEGTFLGIDMGVLELGIVRDSVLNATNDFQVFGERFRNVALLGPAQAARWVTSTVCPTGEFPALTTALSCA